MTGEETDLPEENLWPSNSIIPSCPRATAVHPRSFLPRCFGLPAPVHWGPFEVVATANGANLDYMDTEEVTPQHYAFLVSDAEFDEIFGRIRERKLSYWADPGQTKKGEINHHDGGRGVYWPDPDGHWLEINTRPYGSGS